MTGFAALNIVADDTLRAEPTEELLRAWLPQVERRRPLPGNSSGWCTARARELLGFIPEHSWRDASGDT